jgi:chromosome segregation ATPase
MDNLKKELFSKGNENSELLNALKEREFSMKSTEELNQNLQIQIRELELEKPEVNKRFENLFEKIKMLEGEVEKLKSERNEIKKELLCFIKDQENIMNELTN